MEIPTYFSSFVFSFKNAGGRNNFILNIQALRWQTSLRKKMSPIAYFLFVLLFFIGSADSKHSEKDELITQPEDSYSRGIERHRYKRGLFGVEHEYFRQYFQDKGLLQNYLNARRDGRITNWRSLGDGSTSYTDAIRRSTNYYKVQAESGRNVDGQLRRVEQIVDERIARASRYGGPDRGHSHAINNWRNGQEQIQGGRRTYLNRCGGSNGRKKRGIGSLFRGIARLLGRRGFRRTRTSLRRTSTVRRMRC
ncbi:uncharacterized protein LOC133196749 [Saccostrea echinata]|uniref:uncharacterized protein LOC133196749 n=1 Tax=Saccostrea echinata TaxID=191078 RepID=UPI002A81D860|nr:uncharacterized protein LOC133196749 [Saccostrea echinata]